jgi:hypothetical protein
MAHDIKIGIDETLDPADWESMRTLAHVMVDDAISRLSGVRDGPVWQPMPDAIKADFMAHHPQHRPLWKRSMLM